MGILDHVVAEIIEAKLVVRTIGNIASVSFLAGAWLEMAHALVVVILINIVTIIHEASFVNNDTYGKTEEIIEFTHPAGVALCEVIVYGNDMNAAASKSIKIYRKSCDKSFTFTSLHLGDVAFMKDYATNELYVEWAKF